MLKKEKEKTTHVDRHLVGEAEREDPDAAVDVQEALVDNLPSGERERRIERERKASRER